MTGSPFYENEAYQDEKSPDMTEEGNGMENKPA